MNDKPPFRFARCWAADCPLGAKCLHRIYWPDVKDEATVCVVNPTLAGFATGQCRGYCDNAKIRVAYGMKGLYDAVPHHLRTWVRGQVIRLYGSRHSYYDRFNGKLKIMPDEQQRIAEVFEGCGQKPPVFDRYEHEFAW